MFGRVFSDALKDLHLGKNWEKSFCESYSKNLEVGLKFGLTNLSHPASLGLSLLREYVGGGVYNGMPERRIQVNVKGFENPILGYFDLEEQDFNDLPIGVVEFKTTTALRTQEWVDEEIQGTLYWIMFWNLYRRLPNLTYVIFDLVRGEVLRFDTSRTREKCLETLDLVKKCLDEMELASGDNGRYPGFCDRHREKVGISKPKNHPTINWKK